MNLQSLTGWLKVYFIYLLIAVALSVVAAVQGLLHGGDLSWTLVSVARIGLFAFAAYSLTQLGSPWVRNLHIALNGVSAAIALTGVIGFSTPLGWLVLAPLSGLIYLIFPYNLIEQIQPIISLGSVALPLAWAVYWAMSGQIKNTYLEADGAPGENSPPGEQEFEQAPADGYISAAANENAARVPSANSSRNGFLKGCLISLILLLVVIGIIISSFGEEDLFALAIIAFFALIESGGFQ